MKIRKLIVTFVLSFMASTSFAATATVNGIKWTYTVIDGQAVLGESSYPYIAVPRATTGHITIPSTLGGKRVASIGSSAFSACSRLTSVTIPDSVCNIGSSAFFGCSGLTSVTIGNSVTSIGDYAFTGCSGLSSVTIGNSVTSIGDYAFYDCSGLSSITIPDSVTSIGNSAFSGCSGLTSIIIGSDVKSIGDSAFSHCTSLPGITIPDSAEIIGAGAFSGCSGLTSMTLPFIGSQRGNSNTIDSVFGYIFGTGSYSGGIATMTNFRSNYGWVQYYIPDSLISVSITDETTLGSYAFYNCSGLTSVTITDSVTSVGEGAFEGCSGLTSVTIPDSVTSIGDRSFNGCRRLSNVKIGDGLTNIGDLAFAGCYGLIAFDVSADNASYCSINGLLLSRDGKELIHGVNCNVQIPDGVTSIGERAFSGYSTITSVTIPDSVTSIGNEAFYICSGLTSVVIGSEVKSIGDSAFSHCTSLPGITIPDSVTSIGNSAFSGCSRLTSVTIGDSVTSIGSSAFSGCSGLMSVTIPDGVCNIGSSAFYGCGGLTCVTFMGATPPSGISDSYINSLSNVKVWYPRESADLYRQVVPDSRFGGYIYCLPLGDYVGLFNGGLSTGEERPWGVDGDVSYDGLASLRSGAITHNEESWVEMTASRAGALSFWWKASSEHDGDCVFDYCYVSIDGEARGWVKTENEEYALYGVAIGGETDWQKVVVDIEGEGSHTVRWTYKKDEIDEGDLGEDCVWLDGVEFVERFSLSFDIGGGEGAGPSDIAELRGTVVTLPTQTAFEWEDHVFDGWSDGENTYAGGAEYTVSSGDVTLTAQWTKKTFLTFDLGGGDGSVPTIVKELGGTVVMLPAQTGFIWEDHVFNGWSDGENTYSAGAEYTLPSSDVTLTAQWIAKRFLTFTLDGGEGEIPVTIKDIPDALVVLPSAYGLSKAKHTFVGWSDGSKTYQPGQDYQVADSDVEFTAVWRRNEIEVSISSDVVENGGTMDVECATISIDAVSLPAGGGEPTIYYTVDGTEPTTESLRYEGPFVTTASSVIVKALAVLDNYFDNVAEFSFTRLPYSLNECLDVSESGVVTGGDVGWQRVLGDIAHDGIAALRSGAIGDSQSTWVEMNINGAGEIAFWCKISSQSRVRAKKHDYLSFSVDGVEAATLGGGEIGWTNMFVVVEGIGAHTVRWTYLKDNDETSIGEDCAWLDEVVWTPAGGGAVEPAVEGDDEAVVTGDGENGYMVRPSDGKKEVVVTIPEGVEPGKVTVEVTADVETVKANGANVKVMNEGHDIAAFLDLAAVTSAGGVINLAEAKVKDDVAKEALDTASGADIKLSPTDPSITTANTRPGLKYTFVEGRTIEELAPTEQYKWGDNTPFKPTPSIKGGTSGFYTIKVEK